MARPRASLIYVLSLVMTGLTSCAYNAAPPGIPVAATIHAACCSRSRRVRARVPAELLSYLAFLIGVNHFLRQVSPSTAGTSSACSGPLNRCHPDSLLLRHYLVDLHHCIRLSVVVHR